MRILLPGENHFFRRDRHEFLSVICQGIRALLSLQHKHIHISILYDVSRYLSTFLLDTSVMK